jgi:eukaryotic-like serine/threonine-protein kinase
MVGNSKNKRLGRWRSDSVFGALLVLCVVVLEWSTGWLNTLDNDLYDRASLASDRAPASQIVVLAIDDTSIANIGRWPWSRDVHAQVIDQLAQAGAKTIVLTSLFLEPQLDRGLQPLQALQQTLAQTPDDPLAVRLNSQIAQAIQRLDTDAALEHAMKQAGNVLLPMVFDFGTPLGRPDQALPDFVENSTVLADSGASVLTSVKAHLPLSSLGAAAARLGHLNQIPYVADGSVRADQMLIDHHGSWMPSLALQAAAHSLNLQPQELTWRNDGNVQLGGLVLPMDPVGRVFTQFYADVAGKPAFTQDSFFDLYAGKVPASKYAGKIVVIGATATGVGDRFVTPLSPVTDPATLLAHTTSSYLSGHFFALPYWGHLATAMATVLVGLLVAGVLPRLQAGAAALCTAAVLAALLLGESLLISIAHVWVPLVLPAGALLVAYLGLTTKRFLWTEAGKIKSEEESAETSRLMGLAHQGQGQLDLAFDRFRRVPMTDALMDNLANLALDFERKRQFNKAQAVYEYMAQHNSQYKDLGNRLNRVKQLSETVMLGGGAHRTTSTLVLDDAHIQKPMLGRYQVEKTLGKGAMGVVYLGRDPKIGREVAIKTMALAQEFDGAELDEARQRFFREAETAGRLQHQNIVTIFDAGEDQELAYIAMEFLAGSDLVAHTQPGALLPQHDVVRILMQIAQALDYAHRQNVVHRDIKPANIMYEPNTGTVKVTDFGIARVTDASRTRTGMVLGTPSFMSPEQISGKKVDGRSDLYSLGVMAFQLLSATLPYRAESIAELMYKIANDPVPDVRDINPAVSVPLARMVARAMCKDMAQRYQTGQEMAQDLQQCLATPPTPSTQPLATMPIRAPMPDATAGFNADEDTVVMAPKATADSDDNATTAIWPQPKPADADNFDATLPMKRDSK